mmetsp:Transcript_22185/g.56837  ORF Transcript_22185/g.56837 Transcript_22185/m.56837 type:complete len:230 (+) Transcript_22185:148-837(+)
MMLHCSSWLTDACPSMAPIQPLGAPFIVSRMLSLEPPTDVLSSGPRKEYGSWTCGSQILCRSSWMRLPTPKMSVLPVTDGMGASSGLGSSPASRSARAVPVSSTSSSSATSSTSTTSSNLTLPIASPSSAARRVRSSRSRSRICSAPSSYITPSPLSSRLSTSAGSSPSPSSTFFSVGSSSASNNPFACAISHTRCIVRLSSRILMSSPRRTPMSSASIGMRAGSRSCR